MYCTGEWTPELQARVTPREAPMIRPMTSILDGATAADVRSPVKAAGRGRPSSRAVLADGTPVVIKHIRPNDWLVLTSRRRDRISTNVWTSGVFEARSDADRPRDDRGRGERRRLGRDHARRVRLACSRRGVSSRRAENRRVLEAADALHAEFWGEEVPGVPLFEHYAVITPNRFAGRRTRRTPIPRARRARVGAVRRRRPARCCATRCTRLLDDPAPLVARAREAPADVDPRRSPAAQHGPDGRPRRPARLGGRRERDRRPSSSRGT